jgi:hypothetical protein
MKKDLHIVNGASLAGSLRETGKISDVTYWHEALYMGPLKVLDDPSFTDMRKEYWGRPTNWVLSDEKGSHFFTNLDSLMAKLTAHESITLWFEFDLFDQSMLWYILRQFKQYPDTLPPLFLISPDTLPGIEDFRGMGQLQPGQLLQLLGTEQPVSKDQMVAAEQLWEVYASANNEEMERLSTQDSPLPYANRALRAHLKQIPQSSRQLGDIQQTMVDIISRLGHIKVYRVIGEIIGTYDRDYGLSDLAALELLAELGDNSRDIIEFTINGKVVDWDPGKVAEMAVRCKEPSS